MEETPLFPPLVEPIKHIVVRHTQGPLAGLYRIMGTTDAFPEGVKLPDFVENVDFIDHTNHCSLVAVYPRFRLYNEVAAPEPGDGLPTFHPEQQ